MLNKRNSLSGAGELLYGGVMKSEGYRMLKLKLSVLFFVIIALLAACGKDEVKQVSPETLDSHEAFSVAEVLRSAYAKKDFSAIREYSTTEGHRDIMDTIKHFDTVDLVFTPKWVDIDRNKVFLNVAWRGIWTVSGETFTERGMAIFLLEGKPLKLSKIVRGNPFRYPER